MVSVSHFCNATPAWRFGPCLVVSPIGLCVLRARSTASTAGSLDATDYLGQQAPFPGCDGRPPSILALRKVGPHRFSALTGGHRPSCASARRRQGDLSLALECCWAATRTCACLTDGSAFRDEAEGSGQDSRVGRGDGDGRPTPWDGLGTSYATISRARRIPRHGPYPEACRAPQSLSTAGACIPRRPAVESAVASNVNPGLQAHCPPQPLIWPL